MNTDIAFLNGHFVSKFSMRALFKVYQKFNRCNCASKENSVFLFQGVEYGLP